jgi:thiamine biosynthesis lipoprotein
VFRCDFHEEFSVKHAFSGVLLALALSLPAAAAAEPERHQRENVLGTSFEMIVVDASAQEVDAAVAAALAEIARLDAVLSVWKDDSELSRFNRSEGAQELSDDLRAVLGLCEQWRAKASRAFSCRLGDLLQTWRAADGGESIPDRAEMRKRANEINRAVFDATSKEALVRPAAVRFETDALAKGWIIDRVLEKAKAAAPKAIGIKIDIGGDAVYWGESAVGKPWRVAVADPLKTRDNSGFIATLDLRSRAIAASGHGSRGFEIARKHYSHILDPKEGWPVAYAPSAVVVARDAVTADALATALTVMPVRAGLDLVDHLPDVEALIVTEAGASFVSQGWHALLSADTRSETGWPSDFSFTVDYEIPKIDATNYRRPYLAIWIATKDGNALNQLLVLGDSSRWLQELPLWWRRHGRRNESSISGIARPTRRAGSYSVDWNGRDDQGKAVAPGDYVLHVEAAREHGAHETLELPFTLSNEPFRAERRGESEIGRVSLRFESSKQ